MSEVVGHVLSLAGAVLLCRATPSSSDWALSKLSEINAISSAKSVPVIIAAGERRLLLSVSVNPRSS